MTESLEDDPSEECIIPSPPSLEDIFSKKKLIKPRPIPESLSLLIPPCYKNINKITPNIKLYTEETLFYIFYNFPGDRLQLEAYNRLIDMNYYYWKRYQYFIKFDKEPIVDNIKRTIEVFDPYQWCNISKEINFDNEFIYALENKKI